MKIKMINKAGQCRQGILDKVSVQDIEKILGPSNVQDDPDKVKYSWGFEADGVECGIWDYKGSHLYDYFSFFGPSSVFEKLFPGKVSG